MERRSSSFFIVVLYRMLKFREGCCEKLKSFGEVSLSGSTLNIVREPSCSLYPWTSDISVWSFTDEKSESLLERKYFTSSRSLQMLEGKVIKKSKQFLFLVS